jgi:type IV secretion system protein TrbE
MSMFRNESRRLPHGLADLLLPFALIDDGILLQQDGSLLTGWSYRGPDMLSASTAEMEALSARLNAALRLGTGWMVQCDAIRSRAPGYPERGSFPDPVTRVIDDERRQQFMQEGAHFESEYFLTLTYLPPLAAEERVKGWLYDGRNNSTGRAAQAALEHFRAKVDALRMCSARCSTRSGSQHRRRYWFHVRRAVAILASRDYRHRSPLRTTRHPRRSERCPRLAGFLGRRGAAHWPQAYWRPGHRRLSSIEFARHPARSGRFANRVPLAYQSHPARLSRSARVAGHPPQEVALQDARMEGSTPQNAEGAINLHARDMAADAEQAMSLAASGDVQFCQYTSTILCLEEDAATLHDSVRTVSKTIQNLGFGCRLETINAVEAWRGSIPGDGYSNVRRPLLHTLNLADMLPVTSVWAGLRENPSALMPKHSPPVLYAATTGATPFRFNLHVSDTGHTLIVGPTGAGKSTALGLIAAQWFRYPNAKVFAFDRGYSSWLLTVAASGAFYDLAGPRTSLAFCPLAALDEDSDLTWAVGWVEALCELNGLKFTPRHRNAVAEAVARLQLSPTRTLTELSANVQDTDIRDALEHFTVTGPLGSLLDAERDLLSDGRFLTFEMENLLQLDDKAVIPVLLYLFRRIEQSLDGSPTLVLLDEAWSYLQQPTFRHRLKDWLKTMRRKTPWWSWLPSRSATSPTPRSPTWSWRIARPKFCCPTRRRVTPARASSMGASASTSGNSNCCR